MADVKGDLSGLSKAGETDDKIAARATETGDDDWRPAGSPSNSCRWEPTASASPSARPAFGPILLAKMLGLNETQESTLGLIFHWATLRA